MCPLASIGESSSSELSSEGSLSLALSVVVVVSVPFASGLALVVEIPPFGTRELKDELVSGVSCVVSLLLSFEVPSNKIVGDSVKSTKSLLLSKISPPIVVDGALTVVVSRLIGLLSVVVFEILLLACEVTVLEMLSWFSTVTRLTRINRSRLHKYDLVNVRGIVMPVTDSLSWFISSFDSTLANVPFLRHKLHLLSTIYLYRLDLD